jgi:sarcosine oxidase, subunit beta
MSQVHDIVVVGAGISGAATAYYLKKAGVKNVALFERDSAASGGTGKSAAIVRQHYSSALMARVALQSVDIFRDLPNELGADGGYVPAGYVFLPAKDSEDTAKRVVDVQRKMGIETEWLNPQELAARFDWLNMDGVVGGVFEPRGGYADPVRAVDAYIAAFQRLGGHYHPKEACRGLVRANGKVTGIVTEAGTINAGLVINAAGPWAPFLANRAAVPLHMRSVREQDTIWEGKPGRPLPELSVSAGIDAYYMRPMGDRRYVIGRGFPKNYEDVDPYNYKTTVDDDFVADIQERFERRIPGLVGARLIHSYAALYDVTDDWYPYVGPRVDVAGYCDFNGGSGHGFKIAPGLAQGLASWIVSGKAPYEEFGRLSYDRILEGKPLQASYGGNRG